VARRARESAHFSVKIFSSHLAPLGCGPCVRRTGHPFAASGPRGPSQKIELVFSASPETVSGEPKESFDFRRSLGQGGTWQPARFTILRFSFRCGFYAAMPARPRTGSKSRCSRSTTMRYATNLRATASVAQLAFPFCRAFSYTKARSGFRLGANFAASTRTRWICLFRCFEIGVRATLSADRFSSPQSPQ
jgi:hypothetical protein